MKKIMILGAGIYQVPLIKKAKELGLYTIVSSIPGNYPGFQYADKVVFEDTTDWRAILRVAGQEKIDGICTTGTDVAMITIGKVCEEMGLRGLPAESAEISGDKLMMKKAFLEHNVQTARVKYMSIDADSAEVERTCVELGYPVIFKAIDSSGSRGITIVDGPGQIFQAWQTVKDVTRQDKYLIEEYLKGVEFGAQAFVQDGKLEFVLPHGDYVFQSDTGVPVGHYAPCDQPVPEKEVYAQTQLAIRAMGVDNCAINADFILCGDQVYVVEIGARAGATCLAELVSLYYGYDYYKKIIQVAMGEKVDFTPANAHRKPNASHLIYSEKSGRVAALHNDNPPADWLVDVSFDCSVGNEVNQFRIGPDRLGQVIVTGETTENAKENLGKAMDKVWIEVI